MSFYRKDYNYRGKSSYGKRAKKKFPLIRLLLLLILVVVLWKNRHLITTQWEALRAKFFDFEKQAVVEVIDLPVTQTFKLRKGWWQKSWKITREKDVDWLCSQSPGQERCLIAQELAFKHGAFAGGVIDYFSKDSLGELLMVYWKSSVHQVRIAKHKTQKCQYWIDLSNGCVWKEPCPTHPLEGGAIPIGADFDFQGREYLFTQDLFVGIGESPVFALLGGEVQGVDTLAGDFSVRINHGGGVQTRSSGIKTLAEGVNVGKNVEKSQLLGRLSAQDTTEFTLQITRNGRFVRWADFHQESYPLSDKAFAKFLKSLDM